MNSINNIINRGGSLGGGGGGSDNITSAIARVNNNGNIVPVAG
jgi:serine/threonine protein phosphatase PrpC